MVLECAHFQHNGDSMSDSLYIDSAAALADLCQQLQGSPWITLDTEFLREKTYYPKLCLVQVANADVIACIDPLSIDDLEPFFALLRDPNTVKVLHAATQDLEIFYRLMGSVPAPLFDTQIAASLLGYGDQVGYGRLVEQFCKVQLDKSQSRTDWSRRPLLPRQIDYAADDVRYLRDIYHALSEELAHHGRTEWLTKDFDDLASGSKYDPDPVNAWRKVKQHGRLRGVQLAVLQQLAEWRDGKAMEKDKPRKWIASDDLLIDLARSMPKTLEDLSSLRTAEAGFVRHRGKFILDLVQNARNTPKSEWPKLKDYVPLSANQDAQLDYLMAAAKLKASEHQITLSSLVSRKQLEALLQGDEDVAVMKSWRYTLLGEDLAAILKGEKQLALDGQTLTLCARAE